MPGGAVRSRAVRRRRHQPTSRDLAAVILTYLPLPDFLWAPSQAGQAGEVNHGERPTPAGIVIPHSAVNLPDHMDFDPRCTSGLVAISITPIRYSACLTWGMWCRRDGVL